MEFLFLLLRYSPPCFPTAEVYKMQLAKTRSGKKNFKRLLEDIIVVISLNGTVAILFGFVVCG